MTFFAKLLPNLTTTRLLFILLTTFLTIVIVELVNKKFFISQGKWFKPKKTWVYLFILSSIISLGVGGG